MKQAFLLMTSILILGCTATATKPPPSACTPVMDYDTGLDGRLDSLCGQVAVQLARGTHKSVGLKGFHDLKGRSGRFEKYLEIEFVNRLIRTGMFMVFAPEELTGIDRPGANTKAAVSNHEETQDRYASMTARIDACLVGSTVELPQSVKVSVKLVSVQTGSIFGTASVLIHKDRTLESLLRKSGMPPAPEEYTGRYRTGQVIKAGDNQYVELIPQEYILYVKQVNFEYNLFTNKSSNAEIFLNDEYRVMKVDDMIALTYDDERYILALRNIIDRTATFTFAHLSTGVSPATENFSPYDREPFKGPGGAEQLEPAIDQEPAAGRTEKSNVAAPRLARMEPENNASNSSGK